MKQFFTLLSMGMICLASKSSSAQFSQNFDDYNSLSGNCYTFDGFFHTTSTTDVLTGTGSVYTNPPAGNASRDLSSPYLNFASTNITIAFSYKLSSALANNSTRAIEVGIQYSDNTYTPLQTINVTEIAKTTFNNNFILAKTGVGKLVIKFSGKGNGSSRFIFDDLYTSASPVYGNGTCNTPPQLANDQYIADSYSLYTSTTSVLQNDNEPNGETMTVSLVNSPDGTVTFNADGTFTFLANAGFTGTSTTFTYRVTDNGYDPASSTAIVTINFPAAAVLPVHLLGFQGSVNKDKAQISWSVADNETGSYFEVQRSADGKKFDNIGVQFTSNKTGTESYTYTDPTSIQDGAFYRLKVVNKDYSTSYSKIIRLKGASATADNKITLLQNPVQSSLTFSYTAATAETNEINLYNMAGVKVYSQKVMMQKGSNSMSLNLNSNIPAGSYVVEVAGASTRRTTKFVKF